MIKSSESLPTVSGLKKYQSSILAKRFIETNEWVGMATFAFANNLFLTTKKKTSDRYCAHLVRILSKLNSEQLEMVDKGEDSDKECILWFGFCLAFPFVEGFMENVVVRKYNENDFALSPTDLWAYCADLRDHTGGFGNITNSMRSKVQSVVFGNLREVGFLNGKNEIQTAYLTKELMEVVSEEKRGIYPYGGNWS